LVTGTSRFQLASKINNLQIHGGRHGRGVFGANDYTLRQRSDNQPYTWELGPAYGISTQAGQTLVFKISICEITLSLAAVS